MKHKNTPLETQRGAYVSLYPILIKDRNQSRGLATTASGNQTTETEHHGT